MMGAMRGRRLPTVALALLTPSGASAEPPVRVTAAEMLTAMRESQGYDLTATANSPRLHAEVLLRLIRAARERDPAGAPLLVDRDDWFAAYLERTGLTAEHAPLFARLAWQHGQDALVEHRPERVIRSSEGAQPEIAASVVLYWPARRGAAKSYSYEDKRSSPHLRVTMKRQVSYRLLDFGDMVLYGEIRGLHGKPTTGGLGLLFKMIGEAAVLESRMSVAPDGTQVSRGHGRKWSFDVTTTIHITPEGRADRGLPPGRPDLLVVEERLKRPLRLAYHPLPAVPDR
jgi:hypothetical protein